VPFKGRDEFLRVTSLSSVLATTEYGASALTAGGAGRKVTLGLPPHTAARRLCVDKLEGCGGATRARTAAGINSTASNRS
jgi:hypothetical protein